MLKTVYTCEKIGYVSVFEFDEQELSQQVLNLSRPITDRRVLKWLYFHGFPNQTWNINIPFVRYVKEMENVIIAASTSRDIATELKKIHEILRFYKIPIKDDGVQMKNTKHKNLIMSDFIAAMKGFGFKGFEYAGGSYTKSEVNHRAFSLWDEQYVNAHKVNRFK